MIRLVLAAFSLALALNVSAQEFPVTGGYGFDWLKPTSAARCRVITPTQAATFKKCEFTADGNAFGLPSSYHTCVGSGRSEFFVYESKAKCVEALETMNANGP